MHSSAEPVLDLDAEPPLPTPKSLRWPVVGTRMPAHRHAWLRERAAADGITVNALVNRVLAEAQQGGWPADVREWLLMQAGQCGCPGDPEQALVAVIRHLADRWPYGARLRP